MHKTTRPIKYRVVTEKNKSDSDQIQDVIDTQDSDPTGFPGGEKQPHALVSHEAAVEHIVRCEQDLNLPATCTCHRPPFSLISKVFHPTARPIWQKSACSMITTSQSLC